MYKFDKNLKIIILKYILEIEAVIKIKIANLFAENYGLSNYLGVNNFDLEEDNSNLIYIENLINVINSEIEKSNGKHDAITHYKEKHSDEVIRQADETIKRIDEKLAKLDKEGI